MVHAETCGGSATSLGNLCKRSLAVRIGYAQKSVSGILSSFEKLARLVVEIPHAAVTKIELSTQFFRPNARCCDYIIRLTHEVEM